MNFFSNRTDNIKKFIYNFLIFPSYAGFVFNTVISIFINNDRIPEVKDVITNEE